MEFTEIKRKKNQADWLNELILFIGGHMGEENHVTISGYVKWVEHFMEYGEKLNLAFSDELNRRLLPILVNTQYFFITLFERIQTSYIFFLSLYCMLV